ncbi:murF [Klebsiella pneumoniae subsp. ozaenae]|uniref:MurF n=1 Tax=Klebsiella pneumoniae subsp. ozaenae TaxID=574 RepID=A0A377Z1C4_KLEPO|nr:murF [Klebsiella pneumoniae subsp. ozaenae]
MIGDRKVWRFSPNAANSDFTATNVQITSHGTEFTLQTPTGNVDVLLPLPDATTSLMRWPPLRWRWR